MAVTSGVISSVVSAGFPNSMAHTYAEFLFATQQTTSLDVCSTLTMGYGTDRL